MTVIISIRPHKKHICHFLVSCLPSRGYTVVDILNEHLHRDTTMGWGCSAREKRLIADALGCRELKNDLDTDVVVVDVNASFRARMGTFRTHMTPLNATRMYYQSIRRLYSTAKTFIWCFDDPRTVPEQRYVFYEERRYKKTTKKPKNGQILVDGRIYPEDNAPVSNDMIDDIVCSWCPPEGSGHFLFSRVWSNPKAKQRLWNAISKALAHLSEEDSNDITYIVDSPNSVRSGNEKDLCDINPWKFWGEADAKALHWSLAITDRRVTIDSIDWDMFVQLLILGKPNVSCRIGSIWRTEDGEEYYSKRSIKGSAVQVYEFIHAPTDLTRRERIHAAFWCLAAGGVDYCTGLKPASRGVQAVVSASYKKQRFMHEGINTQTDCRMFRVDTKKLATLVGPEDREEVQRIIYCILYYLSWNPARKPAGPSVLQCPWTNPIYTESHPLPPGTVRAVLGPSLASKVLETVPE